MDKKDQNSGWKMAIRFLLKLQILVGFFFIVLGAVFPVIVSFQHGLGTSHVYNRQGEVIGGANYLILSIGIGVFSAAMGLIAIVMGRKSLRQMRAKRGRGN